MLLALLTTLALAGPAPVVALGDGLVAQPAAQPAPAAAPEAVSAGWIAVLADCLEEHAPGQYSVVDLSSSQDLSTSREQVTAVRELSPRFVVVAPSAPQVTAGDEGRVAFQADVAGLVEALTEDDGPRVLLVGLVPPLLTQVGGDRDQQLALDRGTRAWNGDLAVLAEKHDAVHHVDLLATWPSHARYRAHLTSGGVRLSDQGHVIVAAQVCDVVIAEGAGPPD